MAVGIFSYFTLRAVLGIDSFFPVGENMVSLEFPPPEYSIVYAKPITYFSLLLMTGWVTGLEAIKDRVRAWPSSLRRVVVILALVLAFLTGYEVIYNFSIWSALMIGSASGSLPIPANPDQISVAYPNPETPWNLVFATKFFYTILFIAAYTSIYIAAITRDD